METVKNSNVVTIETVAQFSMTFSGVQGHFLKSFLSCDFSYTCAALTKFPLVLNVARSLCDNCLAAASYIVLKSELKLDTRSWITIYSVVLEKLDVPATHQ